MPFIALNAAEDDIRRNDEKITLEFQFEEALRMFERALAMQKDQDPDTKEVFLELLRFPLFDLNANKNVPPSTPRLKCLALKNYCILLLDELRLEEKPLVAKDYLLHIIDQLLDALELFNDPAVVSLIYSIADALDYPKVARIALEELVSNTAHRPLSAIESSNSSNAANLVGPRDEDALARLRDLTTSIGDYSGIPSSYKQYDSFQRDLGWIRDFGFDNSLSHTLDELERQTLMLKIPKRDLSVVAKQLEESLGKKRKRGDTYQWSTRPMVDVRFQAPHEAMEPEEHEQKQEKPGSDAMVDEVPSAPQTEPNELKSEAAAEAGNEPGAEPKHEDAMDGIEESAPAPAPAADAPPIVVEEGTPDPALINAMAAQPLRSSGRIRNENGMPADFGSADAQFAQNVSTFLALVDHSYNDVLPAFEGESGYLNDFKVLLESWDDEQAALFMDAKTEVDVSQPVMQMLDFAAIKQTPGVAADVARPDLVEELLSAQGNHVQKVRYKLLELMLTSTLRDDPLVLTTRLDAKLQAALDSLVEAFAPQVASFARTEPSAHIAEMAQALFEYYVDGYMSVQREIRTLQSSHHHQKKGGVTNELLNKELLLQEACEWWRGIACDVMVYARTNTALRFEWVSIFHGQSLGDEPDECMAKFEQFQEHVHVDGSTLTFANWTNIPTASYETATTQISKFRAVAIFSRVFTNGAESIPLLEAMLMPETYSMDDLPEAESIRQFLKTCSLAFKLNLWYLLLDQYEEIGQPVKSLQGLIKILDFGVSELKSPEYSEKSFELRSFTLLQCVNLTHDVFKRLFSLAKTDLSGLDESSKKLALAKLIELNEILHIFTMYDHAVHSNLIKGPSHQSWEGATSKLRELTTLGWCLLYLFYAACLPKEKKTPEVLNDFLSVIHDHLGNHGYCSLYNGALLDLNISEILRLDWPHSEADLLQCLMCRHGIALSSETFTPFKHHTITIELGKWDALKLTGFIMRMILSKPNLASVVQRQNVRQVLDTFHTAIGPPDDSRPLVLRNLASIEQFIDTKSLDLGLMRQIIKMPTLSVATSSDPIFSLGSGGLYYLMALVHLNQYKIKKRTTPEKTDDLVETVKFLSYDLAYGSSRFESWHILCQAFEQLAEASLAFTSPEIQLSSGLAVEYQRKAILCGCMAVNALANVRQPPLSQDYFDTLKDSLPALMGKILWLTTCTPLSMAPFELPQKFVFVEGGFTKADKTPVAKRDVLKLALYYLNKSEDWNSIFYKCDLLVELDSDPLQVLAVNKECLDKCAAQATTSSRDLKGNQDPTFEPIQQLLLLVWRYYQAKNVPNQVLIDSLMQTKYVEPPKDASDASLVQTLIACTEGLCNADKKHWMHQPRWLLSQIHENLGDHKKAQEEMENIIATKSTVRPLVGIWRTLIERPGAHFIFCRDYVLYYCDLLYKAKDDLALGQLARKARKFTTISDHLKVWNHILSCATALVKDQIGIPKKFADKQLAALSIGQFEAKSLALEKLVGEKSRENTVAEFSPWLQALDYAHDLKKLNIGLGTTAAVDDLVISVYLCLYDMWEPGRVFEELQKPKPKPTPAAAAAAAAAAAGAPDGAPSDANGGLDATKKSKVSRKDVLTKAALLLRPCSAKLFTKSDAKSVPPELFNQGHQLEDEAVAARKNTEWKPPVVVVPPPVQPIPQPVEPPKPRKVNMMAPVEDEPNDSAEYYWSN